MKNTKTYICWLIRKWNINKQLQKTPRLTLVRRLVQKCLCVLANGGSHFCVREFFSALHLKYKAEEPVLLYVDLYPPVSRPAQKNKQPNPGEILIQHSIQLISQVIKHVPNVIQNVPCRLHYVRSAKRETQHNV